MVLTTVRNILVSDTDVTDICGQRVELLTKPQDIGIPAVCLFVVSTNPINGLADWNDLDSNSVQVDSYATTYKEAKELASACRLAMEAAGNQMEFELDNFEQDVELTGLARVTQQYTVWTS